MFVVAPSGWVSVRSVLVLELPFCVKLDTCSQRAVVQGLGRPLTASACLLTLYTAGTVVRSRYAGHGSRTRDSKFKSSVKDRQRVFPVRVTPFTSRGSGFDPSGHSVVSLRARAIEYRWLCKRDAKVRTSQQHAAGCKGKAAAFSRGKCLLEA
jgi:hypothetical protein